MTNAPADVYYNQKYSRSGHVFQDRFKSEPEFKIPEPQHQLGLSLMTKKGLDAYDMKALFLDIDGVVQSPSDSKRFEHTKEFVELSKRLTHELNNGFDYYEFGGVPSDDRSFPPSEQYDVAAVYYDWRPEVVERIRYILDTTGAKIVLSSDWREKGLENMKGLLDIHGLGKYLYPTAPFFIAEWKPYVQNLYAQEELYEMSHNTRVVMKTLSEKMASLYPSDPNHPTYFDDRAIEIREFLDRHPEITAYVALDDRNLTRGLEGHFVQTWPIVKEEQVDRIIALLNQEDGPYHLPDEMKSKELELWREKWVYNCKYNRSQEHNRRTHEEITTDQIP